MLLAISIVSMARATGIGVRPIALQLGIDEFDVEAGIVDHERRIAEEFQELVRDVGEQRLVGEKFVGQAVHALGFDAAPVARD